MTNQALDLYLALAGYSPPLVLHFFIDLKRIAYVFKDDINNRLSSLYNTII
jgi:hypothetical protein